jgi:hypothetical protein
LEKSLHQLLSKHPVETLADVWNIEQLNVPTSHHIRNILHPVVDESDSEVHALRGNDDK